ncbi:hypothetical protein K7432_009898 [Basidiobolus ranarum]|uniref:Mechanosensitive ion channel MscS domain-containing protein n=1 Tax=Basidiobolus ranarum TaxID=34480 RepID=A0ABR2VWG6_9FUNG
MTIPKAWEMGISGLVGLIIISNILGRGFCTTLENFMAGLQISWSEPFALLDYVTVDGHYGRIEEIRGFYVVLQITDKSQQIVPLSRFVTGSFQNWSRGCEHSVGEVKFHVDYQVSITKLRTQLQEIVGDSPLWDKRLATLKVLDIKEKNILVQCLVSATNVETVKELECEVREKLLEYIVNDFSPVPRNRSRTGAGEGRHHTWYEHITNRNHSCITQADKK